MFLHSEFSPFESGSSCHCPDKENLSNLGLTLKSNGNFCLYLFGIQLLSKKGSTQRAMLTEVKPHGEALEEDNCWGKGEA